MDGFEGPADELAAFSFFASEFISGALEAVHLGESK